jgi:hypothetical protein
MATHEDSTQQEPWEVDNDDNFEESQRDEGLELDEPASRLPYTRTKSPKNLNFYSSQWRDNLEDAKVNYTVHICAEKGFPARDKEGLADAEACLMEAIAKHVDEGGQVERGIYHYA